MSTPNPFIFKRGDVRILATYEGEEVVGSVSSHAMALASPVWEMFVVRWENPETASTASPLTPGKEKAINFKEDDGEAFILHHVHHLDQNPGVLVFNLCICHTGDSAKLSVCYRCLSLAF
jgi:hypothetical protein